MLARQASSQYYVWFCLPVISLYMEKDTKSAVYGCKSCSLCKGAQLDGTVSTEMQPMLHWPSCAPSMSWVYPKKEVPISNLNKDAYGPGGHPETDPIQNLGKRTCTQNIWGLEYSIYVSLNFRKSDGFKASPSCGNPLHKKRPSGVTKDIIAITFIKKKHGNQCLMHRLYFKCP